MYENSIYIIITCPKPCKSIKFRLYTYNNNLWLEYNYDLSEIKLGFALQIVEDSLLERKYGLCSGIIERDFDKNVDISTIIVEKFQGFVIVRGRHCIGILNEDEEVCQHCISLFTNDTFTTYTKSKSTQYSRKENNSRQDKKLAPSEKETKVKRLHEDETNEIQTYKKAKQDEFSSFDTKMKVDT